MHVYVELIFWTEHIVTNADDKFSRLNQIQIWYAVSVEKENKYKRALKNLGSC